MSKYLKKLKTIFPIRRNVWNLTILIPMFIYALLYVLTVKTAMSSAVIRFLGNELPVTAFTGVISSLSNICLVIMVLFYKKPGFIIAMIILVMQMPAYFVRTFVIKNISSLPGFFMSIFTMLMLVIIYNNHVKMAKEKERLHSLSYRLQRRS